MPGLRGKAMFVDLLPNKKSRKSSIENFTRNESVSLVAKRGIIKEYIDTYVNGITATPRQLEDFCRPGTEVFYCELKASHPAFNNFLCF